MIAIDDIYFFSFLIGIAGLFWFANRIFTMDKLEKGEINQRVSANEKSINRLEEMQFRLQAHVLGKYEPPPKVYAGDSDAMSGVNAHINVKIFITEYFNREEMLSLAFDIGIIEENEWTNDALPGEIARKIVNFAYRNKQISRLKHEIKRLRPHFGVK